ncbi:MAG: hypothetical protein ACOYD4_06835 [Solirubrobacterales bacterium]
MKSIGKTVGALVAVVCMVLLMAGAALAQTTMTCVFAWLGDGGFTQECHPQIETPTETPTVEATATETLVATPLPTSTLVATETPVPATLTPVPPTATPLPMPTMDMTGLMWHTPMAHMVHGVLTTVHEHGDAPPAWVVDYNGGQPLFEHVAGTPNENGHDGFSWWKHTSFKGWAGRFGTVDWYGIFHLDFNPSGHPSRFHSYQLWLRDATGAVSHMHGWLDFGTGQNTYGNVILRCNTDSQVRPIIQPVQQGCPVQFETWYARAGGSGQWAPDFGFNINPNYFANVDYTVPGTPDTWVATGGIRNLTRRIEFAWYASRSNLRGDFWTDQFGVVATGPSDAICGASITVGTKTYTRVCLLQHIAPTLPTIQFPGNAIQRTFPGPAILPN